MTKKIANILCKVVFALCFYCYSMQSFASVDYNGRIKGKIITSDGEAASWVTVKIKNTTIATTTDEDGIFIFQNLKSGKYTLMLSYTGFTDYEKEVTVGENELVTFYFTMKETAKQLDEIVIDGRRSANTRPVAIGKVPIALMNLPQSISVISQAVIRNQQAQRLSDVIENVPGIYLSSTRGSTQETFAARGYRLSTDNMYKNGARVNSGVMPEMSSLEKVEVLKGSAAILYGSVAPGGIINMVTKQPKFEKGGEVSMRAGSYGLYKPAFDIYGPVNSTIAFRLNGTYETAQSFRDEVHSNRYYFNPSVLFKINDKTTLVIEGDYLHHKFTPDFGIGSLNNNTIANVPRSTFLGVAWQYNKADQATATFSVKHKINQSWNLNFTGSYQSYHRDYYSTERIQATANGDWRRPLNKILSNENYFIGQVNLSGKFKTGGIGHTLLAGVDGDKYATTRFTFNNPKNYDSINILDPSKYIPRTDMPAASKVTSLRTPTDRMGAYVQDLISISNKIKLLAGVRWSYQKAQSSQTNYFAKDSIAMGGTKTDQAFSPRFGIVYKPLSGTAVFSSFSNSFSVNRGTDIYCNALPPSIIGQYELGVKNDFMDGALSVNITGYKIINHNLAQTAAFAADGVTPNNDRSIRELTGQTTSDGVEVEITGHPIQGLDVIAGYSYNNMRYTKTTQLKGDYVEGERLVGTPAHTANGSLFYTFKNRLSGLTLGASAFYKGDRFGGWNNKVGQPQNYSKLIPVAGFTVFDFSAGYTYRKVSLIAKISNIGNVYNYNVHENYSINPIPPRQFITTLSYRF